jgi:hypothetical protein
VITGLNADDTSPDAGQPVRFTVDVKNEGDGKAEGVRVVWQPAQGAPFLLQAENISLESNEQTAILFEYTFTEEGIFQTQAVVSFGSAQALAATQNSNARSLTITVGPVNDKPVTPAEAPAQPLQEVVQEEAPPPAEEPPPPPPPAEEPPPPPPPAEEPPPPPPPAEEPPPPPPPLPAEELSPTPTPTPTPEEVSEE